MILAFKVLKGKLKMLIKILLQCIISWTIAWTYSMARSAMFTRDKLFGYGALFSLLVGVFMALPVQAQNTALPILEDRVQQGETIVFHFGYRADRGQAYSSESYGKMALAWHNHDGRLGGRAVHVFPGLGADFAS